MKYKISPTKFVLRHYPFITREQAMKKLSERLSRTGKNAESKLGWHSRYKKLKEKNFLNIDHTSVFKYNEDNHWILEKKYNPYPNSPTS